MTKPENKTFIPLDREEKDLMESLENDEWHSVSDLDLAKKTVSLAACPKHS